MICAYKIGLIIYGMIVEDCIRMIKVWHYLQWKAMIYIYKDCITRKVLIAPEPEYILLGPWASFPLPMIKYKVAYIV